MDNTNELTLTDDQFRVLYDLLNDVYPQVKDPEPAFLELFDYVTEEYELTYGQFELSAPAKAFSKVYPDTWAELLSRNSAEWVRFKQFYDQMDTIGLLKVQE